MARLATLNTARRLESNARIIAILTLVALGLSLLPVSRAQAQNTGGTSLSLNGTTAYAEAPYAAELSGTGDWTIEAWFKDENPTYNHARARMLTKGDIASAEVPFFASIGSNVLTVGLRTGGSAFTQTYNLTTGGVTPNAWHHFAASLQAGTRVLTLYVDGTQRAQGTVGSASNGNTLPLILGRSGTGGDYWLGKLDDVRVWNVVRGASEINAGFGSELTGSPVGLVGNWRFNEGSGTAAVDTTGTPQNASLIGGAGFSTDVPPATSAPTLTPVPAGFSLTAAPAARTIGLTGTVPFEATVSFGAGFITDRIDLSISGLPAGVSALYQPNPLPHQGKAALNLTADGSPLPGIYTVTVVATASGITRSQNVTLIVTDQPDFTVGASPITQSVSAGSAVSYDVQVSPINAFANPLSMSVSGLPSGATGLFSPNPLPPGSTGTLNVVTSGTAPVGDYTVTVTGASGGLSRAAAVQLLVRPGAVWSISPAGSTGSGNNTARVGQVRNDGLNRLYVGTVDTGRVVEFSWNGSAWGAPLDVGGSPGGTEIHNMGIGPGRNDGLSRLYVCSLDGNLYEVSYNGGWSQTTVGAPTIPGEYCLHATVADGRADGRNRLYAARGRSVWEYTWNGSAWDQYSVGTVSSGLAHGVYFGNGRGGNTNYLYVASTASGTYEARFSGGTWTLASMGDTGDIRNVSVGAGRNDGVKRVYSATATGLVRELTWNGSAWGSTVINTAINSTMVHAYVLDGRNDGVQRVYSSAGDGNCYEFTYSGGAWSVQTLGGGSGYMYGMHYGAARNDGQTRLYGASFNQQVYEYTWPGGGGPVPDPTTVTPTMTSTPTQIPTNTLTVTVTPTPTPTGTATTTATATRTSTATSTSTAIPASAGAGNLSLALNGTTAYAEAPHATELSGTGDWTIEAWFKDENPTYNHPRARILTKGDISSGEVPFFASIGSNVLTVGLRSGGAAYTQTYNLAAGGVTSNAWHHLAATFQAASRTLTIYVDGTQRAQGAVGSASNGNALPLILGRSGTGGDYWRGKLDDVRVWNVVRTAADIASNFRGELAGSPGGMVGNWRFNEGAGTTAVDSAGTAQNAALVGGAGFAADVHL